MMDYAVMGNPIAHSLSPLIHQHFAKQFDLVFEYGKILVEPGSFEQQVTAFFQAGGKGLNITSPCKQQAFMMSGETTARCTKAQAANTLWCPQGTIKADTTDGIGLLKDLRRYLDITNKRILILGAGGAVRGILQPLLDEEPVSITLANRTLDKAVELQTEFNQDDLIEVVALAELKQSYDLIIHATASAEGIAALPKVIFQNALLAYDLTYQAQGLTAFVSHARSLSCEAVDGFGMLVCQAAESFNIWHGVMPDVSGLLDRKAVLGHLNRF